MALAQLQFCWNLLYSEVEKKEGSCALVCVPQIFDECSHVV